MVPSGEFGKAHYNKKKQYKPGEAGGKEKGKTPAKAPALELCFV